MSMDRLYRRAIKAANTTAFPGIDEGTWYGRPGLLVKGKGFMAVKDADTLVFRCALEEKDVLMEAAPEIYFETDHYKGWPAVLVRASAASDAELSVCIKRAWGRVAPAKLRTEMEQAALKLAPPAKKKQSKEKR